MSTLTVEVAMRSVNKMKMMVGNVYTNCIVSILTVTFAMISVNKLK